MSRLLGIRADRLASYASAELARAVVALREVKEPAEIEEIERACETAGKMHRLAMRMCRPGITEREIAGRSKASPCNTEPEYRSRRS